MEQVYIPEKIQPIIGTKEYSCPSSKISFYQIPLSSLYLFLPVR